MKQFYKEKEKIAEETKDIDEESKRKIEFYEKVFEQKEKEVVEENE